MQISRFNSIKLNNANSIKTNTPQQRYTISFKSDVFEPSIRSKFGNLDEKTISLIKDTIKNEKPIASGYHSNIFKLDNFIIKAPKIVPNNEPKRGNNLDQNLREYSILKKIEEIDENIAVKAQDIIEYKGINYLVEDFIDNGVHPNGNKIKNSHLKDLLNKFALLDQHGIVSPDLHSGNIFLLENGETRLIDFEAASVLKNNGEFNMASHLQKNNLLESETAAPYKKRFLRSFFISDRYASPSFRSDNPYLNIVSNISNFEYRLLYSRLKDEQDSNPLEFFRNYIQNKGKIYHSNMEKFLESLNIEDAILPTDSNEEIEKAKSKLQNAIQYEKLAQDVFENPSDKLLKVELAKIQLKPYLWPDDLGSKIPNRQKVESACSQLKSLLEENIGTSKDIEKSYFIKTLEKYEEDKSWIDKYKIAHDSVEIPENENLIKILFKKTL